MARSYQTSPDSTLTITDSETTTCVIDMTGVDGGHFQIASGTVTTITWHASVRGLTTVAYKPALDGNGSAVTQTVNTTNDFPIPSTLNGRRFLKPVAGSGTSGVMILGVKQASQS